LRRSFSRLAGGQRHLPLEALQRFLVDEQHDEQARDASYVEHVMRR
jgi:hypothetical protein